jgi:23S rRNA pseudouridine2605 synthase
MVKNPSSSADRSAKLHKMLAQAGLGSRRAMEALITAGRVTVNGTVATRGTRVGSHAVRLRFQPDRPRILLYHKPEGEIVSRSDPQGRPTVFVRLPPLRGAKWIAVGRLDFNSSGLLMFTTSGELAHALMHPRFEIEREYAVRVMGLLSEEQLATLANGVEIEGHMARFEALADAGGEGANHWYRVVLKEGRKHEVRRIFAAVGRMVTRLIRVRYGIIAMPPRLKRGRILELDPHEVDRIVRWTSIQPSAARSSERPVPRQPRQRPSSLQARSSRRSRNTT